MHKIIIFITPENTERIKEELFKSYIGTSETYEHVCIQSKVTHYYKLPAIAIQKMELDKVEIYISDESNRIFGALEYLKGNLPDEHSSYEHYHLEGNHAFIGTNYK
ncbi:hypothetical protein DICPUDRAFT_97731 [Dictyostelium purpureum]|uniref:Uncharacterized protein n=1 Tax=Dictyostelium purpureum TaxID=5786 RepID=F0ZJB4_DICPU|nr:uncharacterized protein DICPUDRAFT_97731 [Dictyostelium purpureum]EGC35949.1 hypothetical protein DICPUDRAFT_97731 [Dictyostelium purpureum]|eukprot:XP_003287522.1 hypothetical protein DICPUDRAFT_97731 [Dictyostelium purpureum]